MLCVETYIALWSFTFLGDKADSKDFTRLDWAPSLNMTTECNESSVKQSEENLEGHQRSEKHQEDKNE